jgi:hypothetical protein
MSSELSAVRRFGRGLSVLMALGLAACAVLAYLLPVAWLTGLLQHFPAYYATSWFFVACLAWSSQSSKWLAYTSICGGVIFAGYWSSPRIPVVQNQVVEGETIHLVFGWLGADSTSDRPCVHPWAGRSASFPGWTGYWFRPSPVDCRSQDQESRACSAKRASRKLLDLVGVSC